MEHLSYPAFHVLWTKPSDATGRFSGMNKAEILTMIISALMWQKYNGTIKLYTDNRGYQFIKEQNLLSLWDGGIDTDVLESNRYPINPEVFWAAGKLIALEAQDAPCVMLDTDLIVMRSLHDLLRGTSITALHAENPEPEVYLEPSLLKCPKDFKFPESYNWDVWPSNTAFLYIREESFKKFYLNEAKRFMFHNTEQPAEAVSQMVFAEQRMLSICAEQKRVAINYLLTDPFSSSNNTVIHLWGFKNLLRQNDKIQAIYSSQLIKSVENELSTNVFFNDYIEKHPCVC
ncbi:MAG: hypothetical protein Q8904_14265 [Bacteroidota bacterium]|nr:hypothetical protein [Bacteroidota bacterium]